MKEYKKLIIAPHLDDEVLGCSSILDQNSLVLYVGYDESYIQNEWVRKRPSTEKRIEEMLNVKEYFSFDHNLLNNKVNNYKETEIISSFEKTINDYKPDVVFIPSPSYNQDHRAVYNASLVALRHHDLNHFVDKVVIYEQVQDVQSESFFNFTPHLFVPMLIEKKLEAYALYTTQVRSFRSPDMITTIAKLRGMQAKCSFAEAFQIIRWKV